MIAASSAFSLPSGKLCGNWLAEVWVLRLEGDGGLICAWSLKWSREALRRKELVTPGWFTSCTKPAKTWEGMQAVFTILFRRDLYPDYCVQINTHSSFCRSMEDTSRKSNIYGAILFHAANSKIPAQIELPRRVRWQGHRAVCIN